MIGLHIQVRGRRPVTEVLDQDNYLVAAGAVWRRTSPRHGAVAYFHGSGIDDRNDHVRWLRVPGIGRGDRLDIAIVDARTGTVPVRCPRRNIDWRKVLAEQRQKDLKRSRELEERLRDLQVGKRFPERTWVRRLPAIAFRLKVNGRELGKVAVSDPGSLGIGVVVTRRAKYEARLSVHGSDRIGRYSSRERRWPWHDRRLRVGDRVSIEVVSPVGLSRGRIGKVQTSEPRGVQDIAQHLKQLRTRLASDYYRVEAVSLERAKRERSPARRYSRRVETRLVGH
jgi:hypothetical protein